TQDAALAISLIPSYLANLLWIIDRKFFVLAQQGYGQNAVVYACLRLLSQSVAEPPVLIYMEASDGTLDKVAPDHPLYDLIHRPNELLTEYEFWELITL